MFADGVRAERKRQGLKQQELSDKSGVPQSTISAIECGDRSPTEETMVMIAKGLNCTVGELLGEEKKITPANTLSERDIEMVKLGASLSPVEFQRVRDFVSGLIAARTTHPSQNQ